MNNKMIYIAIALMIFIGIGMLVKMHRAVQADKYNFEKKGFVAKLKYIVKTTLEITSINVSTEKWKRVFIRNDSSNKCKVVLFGASISRYWHISEYFPNISNVVVYNFDKRERLKEYLENNKNDKSPDVVILKECAAFINADKEVFHQSFDGLKETYKEMVKIVMDHGKTPIAATICPVAYEGEHLNNIVEYNEWVKQYSEENGLYLLDFDKQLRISDDDKRLKVGISQEDGLHLKRNSYEEYLNPFIEEQFEHICMANN